MRPWRPARRTLLRLALVAAVLCLVPIQGATAHPAAAGSTCHSIATSGCVEADVVRTGQGGRAATPLRVAQFNLCDSGQAPCFTHGRSTVEAAGVITRYRPDLVTLNEVCSRDVLDRAAPIRTALAGLAHADGDATVFALFTPAIDEVTGQPYHCVDGDLYGIGIVGRGVGRGVGRTAAPTGPPTRYVYRSQYSRSDEGRVALCATVGGTDVCTTHLESDSPAVARRECGELLGRGGDVDRFREATALRPIVVGGDFNLGAGSAGCVPPGWRDQDDRGVQHIVAGTAFREVATVRVPMHYTDHPALLVDLAAAAGERNGS